MSLNSAGFLILTHSKYIGPDLGAHTNEVLEDILGLSKQDIEKLDEDGITKPQ